ncbi:MAG: radical SAM superfamily enzyme YgiQ (UPF0313 family) [Candidatus Aldehydirespiratoraceae bacterium]|jgi:radical SAM superfamily enzyme YgiQ (UPF0313 family)
MASSPNWLGFPIVSIDGNVQLCARNVPAPWDALNIARHSLTLQELRFLHAWRTSADAKVAGDSVGLSGGRLAAILDMVEEFGLTGAWQSTDPTELTELEDAPPIPIDEELILCSPQAWSIGSQGFVRYDHDGQPRGCVDAVDVWAARMFNQVTTVAQAWDASTNDAELREYVSSLDEFAARADRLMQLGVLVSVAERPEMLDRSNVYENRIREGIQLAFAIKKQFRDLEVKRRESLEADGLSDKIPIYGVVPASPSPPLALGAIYAAAKAATDPRLDVFDLQPRWVTVNADMADQPLGPAVYMFSDYIWSHQLNLDFSAELKKHNPEAITIHGGPDCPTYDRDAVRYLDTHPYVDIAVRGEGEATAIETLGHLGSILRGDDSWSTLQCVEGVAFREEGEVVRTADRDRITDLDSIPSPFLDGTFAAYENVPNIGMAIVETNRGCPYGCTFCDWGSATNSRIRKFDLDRVKAELDWCAKNKVKRVFFADANFGIFSRDVEIATHFADLKRRYGFPQRFITNYAKNTVKHLTEIVTVLTEAGVVSEGLLSLQSLDDATLKAIRRSNIKLEKYEALAAEFRASKLPLFVDLMMGLPGQTVKSLHNDLQECVDRGVLAKCHGTELLVNSPMNEPEYRKEYAVESTRPPGPLAGGASRPAFVVSTSSFTRADYAQMHEMRRFYLLAENHGVLRYVAPLVRQSTGMKEVEFYERVRTTSIADVQRWPWLSFVASIVPDTLSPPPSWRFVTDELRTFLLEELGLSDDTALDAALQVQHAMLPDASRSFPEHVELAHDYPEWQRQVHHARETGNRADWETIVPPLVEFEPIIMTVEDPRFVCTSNTGHGSVLDSYNDWELDAPISRAVAAHFTV